MKKSTVLLLVLVQFCFLSLMAQADRLPSVDKSPMDMSYYPSGYPVLKIQDKASESPVARVVYSRPQKAGRVVFGELVKYGEVWRLGANEATEIEFFKSVTIAGKKIDNDRYTLYAIANPDEWTIILNRETDTWGSFKYDAKKDVVRTTVKVQQTATVTEHLTMAFEKATSGFNLIIAWDNVKVMLPITQ